MSLERLELLLLERIADRLDKRAEATEMRVEVPGGYTVDANKNQGVSALRGVAACIRLECAEMRIELAKKAATQH
jgi:hypothetical protein